MRGAEKSWVNSGHPFPDGSFVLSSQGRAVCWESVLSTGRTFYTTTAISHNENKWYKNGILLYTFWWGLFHLKDSEVLCRLLSIEIILLTGEIQAAQEHRVGNCWKTHIEHVGWFSRGSKHTGIQTKLLPKFRGRSRLECLLCGALNSCPLANTCWSETDIRFYDQGWYFLKGAQMLDCHLILVPNSLWFLWINSPWFHIPQGAGKFCSCDFLINPACNGDSGLAQREEHYSLNSQVTNISLPPLLWILFPSRSPLQALTNAWPCLVYERSTRRKSIA